LEGLEEAVIPLEAMTRAYSVDVVRQDGKIERTTVHRKQFPMTLAYAFTDYRAQGQTIPYVIVDIATPPSGFRPNLFNLYVALSRSSGRETIRLLRDFDASMFKAKHDSDLLKEDERMTEMDAITIVQWAEIMRLHV
jgi:ATP-dependent exoDNAse (exonuclease V) alpha subunit